MNFLLNRISLFFVAGFFIWSGLLVPIIHAEDIYVAQTARGGDTGADTANAHSLAWINTAANWGLGVNKVSPGDTVHLSGTFTSTFTIQASGTSGNIIKILFEPGAKFEKAVWESGAIAGANKSYITIDGGTNGLIQATGNGTALGNRVNSIGLNLSGTSNFIIRNLKIDKMYVRTPGSTDGNRYGQPIVILDIGSNVTIENCSLFEGDTCIGISYGGGIVSNLIIRNNTIGRCNHGITVGTNTDNSYVDDMVISGNRINDLDVWEGNTALHLDGVILFNESPGKTGSIRRMRFYGNHIGPNIGKTNTAGLFMNYYVPAQFEDAWVYNNLFTAAPGLSWSNGFISGVGLIVNNTFVAGGVGIGVKVGENSIVQNNLFYSVGLAIFLGEGARVTDFNIFHDLSSNAFYDDGPEPDRGMYSSLPLWQAIGHDTHSVDREPALDANYVPTTGDSVARGKGLNLSNYFKTDMNGNPRPSTLPWTIGAFEGPGTGTPSPAPTSTPSPAPTSTPSPAPTSTPSPAPTSAPSPASTPLPSGANVALAGNGGVASASSTFSSNYAVTGVNNSERSGIGWAAGSGGWADATPDTYPDWVEIAFSGSRIINEIDVFTLQDHYQGFPPPPTESTTFSMHGITDFDVQYWNGSAWINVPGGQIKANNLVWRKLTFAGINTTKIRVVVNKALGGRSRIVEIEAYTSSVVPAPTPIATATPTPTPTSGIPTAGEPFAADSVEPTPPFAVTNGYISQPRGTSLADGGRVSYEFTVPDHGEYTVIFEVNAANWYSNSLYLNVDAEPEDPVMTWDIPVTNGFENRIASWRGGGTIDNNQFAPKYFLLSPGKHELIIRGKESNTEFKTITIVKR